MSVETVKDKLWKKCGTSLSSMRLELYDDCKNKLCDLSDGSRPLGFYSPLDGIRIHVVDLGPSSVTSGRWLEEKFREKMAAQNPSATFRNKMSDDYMEDLWANIRVGARCEVELGEKRGVVKYVGQAEALGSGFWVGVRFDEPLGKHDGMLVKILNEIPGR